jgi:hypothetical protein
MECKDETGVEKQVLISSSSSFEVVRCEIQKAYGRTISFIYEDRGLHTVTDEISWQKCLARIKSCPSFDGHPRLEVYVIDSAQGPGSATSIRVENDNRHHQPLKQLPRELQKSDVRGFRGKITSSPDEFGNRKAKAQ